jgi:NADPH-dependent curcumin reductase CurA
MNAIANRKIVLAARPQGVPKPSDFSLVDELLPPPGPGQMLLQTLFLSLDPYMRGRMNDAKSYAPSVAIGELMVGGTVCRVAESNLDGFAVGDVVLANAGWQEFSLSEGQGLRKLDTRIAPVSTALGVLGMPGMTAYCGLLEIGQPQAGEIVVVAAASGPVGSMVGQIARKRGARAVGIAGGPEKCAFVREQLGFDDCVDHRSPDLPALLAAVCPKGIDVYFENVGGAVFRAVLPLLNLRARIPVCGLVSQYNAQHPPEGGDYVPALMRSVLSNRLLIRGFIVTDFAPMQGKFLTEVGAWVKDGSIKYREDITDGLEAAPAAFTAMLTGGNFGKALVRVAA